MSAPAGPGAGGAPPRAALLAAAMAHHRRGALAEAAALYRRVLAGYPRDFDALHMLGVVAAQDGAHGDAIALLSSAAAERPSSARARFNLAGALMGAGRLREAIAALDEVVAIDPRHAAAWTNRGICLMRLNEAEEAGRSHARAAALEPHAPEPRFNRSQALLVAGRLTEAWPDYEARLRTAELAPFARHGDVARWDGGPCEGRRILLHAEQGMGDTIHFARYAPLVARRGAQVVLEVQAPLASLLARVEGVAEVVAQDRRRPAVDLACPLPSLPLAFATTLATIPAPGGYLSADPARLASWRERLGPRRGPRVALAWRGSAAHRNDANRSIGLARLAPHLPPGIEVLSLQKEMGAEDAAALRAIPGARDLGAELRDFEDSAALCALADRVACVDTSLAHLAGALGRPVDVLLPFAPDWRWMLGRGDSPWYASATLHRQDAPGDWSAALASLARSLAALARDAG
ncbi:MAG: tetratricopeptide repeat protein [Alphaproteobacteria bacterium]